jgi:site-specific recombinase XerD
MTILGGIVMKLTLFEKPKYLKEIENHKELYKKKNLKFMKRNRNGIFYWRFLSYLEDIGYRPRTIQKYYDKLRNFLHFIGKKSLKKIKRKDVDEYLLFLKNEKKVAPYTLRYYKEDIETFFWFVMRFSSLRTNPASRTKIRTNYKQPEKMDLFTREETMMIVKKPLQILKRTGKDDYKSEYLYKREVYTIKLHYLILKLMFSTGIRPWELVNIEGADLMSDDLKIRIRSKGNQQYIMRKRNVFITKKTKEEINELTQHQKPIRIFGPEDRLFIHYNGGKLSSNYPNRVLKIWALRCGIKRNVYAYMARYTYCTRLVENGIDLYSLKKLMGHKKIEVTLTHYFKLTKTELRHEWKTFNPLNERRYDEI